MRPLRRAAAAACAAAVLLALPAMARAAEPATGELPNGLRYGIVPRPGSDLTAIDIWVRAGSAYEATDEAGAAHLLEHMIFKGTPTRGPGGVDAAVENMGGVLSAGTLRGFAHFHTVVECRYVREALAVMADALRHPTLDAAEMERERRVVLAELARRANDGGVAAADAVWAGLFAGSPTAAPPSGAAAGIRTLTTEALRRFHSRLYRPDAVCVAIAGGAAPPEAVAALEATLGDWAKPAEPAQAPPNPTRPEALLPGAATAPVGVAVPSAPEGRVWFAAGFAVSDGASDLCDRMLGLLVADPAVGRLAQAASTSVTGRVSVETSSLSGLSVTLICGAVDGPMSVSPLAAIRATLQGVVDRPPDAAEVAGVRARLLGLRLFELETCAGAARAAGQNLSLRRAVTDLSLRQASAAVTCAQIAARATEWLNAAARAEAIAHAEAAP